MTEFTVERLPFNPHAVTAFMEKRTEGMEPEELKQLFACLVKAVYAEIGECEMHKLLDALKLYIAGVDALNQIEVEAP